MSEYRNMTRNILRHFRAADDDAIAAGLQWYDRAFTQCERLGWLYGHTATHAAVALAHLSPRITWQQNLDLLEALLAGKEKPVWGLGRSWAAASASLTAEDPLATFSRRALKTRSFALAITGDKHSVTVDVWAARIAGVAENAVRRGSVYIAVADAYRRAGRIEGICARDLQAITWCHHRGTHL